MFAQIAIRHSFSANKPSTDMNVTSCTQHSAGSGTIPYDAVDDSEIIGMFC